MITRFFARFWIPVLLISTIIGLIIAYLLGFFARDGICSVPPYLPYAADGVATAKVQTWNDLNGNGILDSGEPPLPWVTINISWPNSITNKNGNGSVEKFKPGCVCNCWEDESVEVIPPFGYRATTPTKFQLIGGDEITYKFGFQKDDTQLFSFPGEPNWFQAYINRGIVLSAFHYSSDKKTLSLEIASTSQEKEQVYSDIFNVTNRLGDANIDIRKIGYFIQFRTI